MTQWLTQGDLMDDWTIQCCRGVPSAPAAPGVHLPDEMMQSPAALAGPFVDAINALAIVPLIDSFSAEGAESSMTAAETSPLTLGCCA